MRSEQSWSCGAFDRSADPIFDHQGPTTRQAADIARLAPRLSLGRQGLVLSLNAPDGGSRLGLRLATGRHVSQPRMARRRPIPYDRPLPRCAGASSYLSRPVRSICSRTWEIKAFFPGAERPWIVCRPIWFPRLMRRSPHDRLVRTRSSNDGRRTTQTYCVSTICSGRRALRPRYTLSPRPDRLSC